MEILLAGSSAKLLVVLMFALATASGQTRFLYTFDVESGSVDSVQLNESNSWLQNSTSWSVGELGYRVELQSSIADDSLEFGRTTRMYSAAERFDVASYPIRCSAALRIGSLDSTRHACSAVIVGVKWAVTAAHCVVTFQKPPYKFVDRESYIAPAWDNGTSMTLVQPSRVIKVHIVRQPGRSPVDNDVALLELEEPIGNQIGWVGIYSAPPASWVENVLVHRLSYPSGTSMIDSTLVYDGNNLMARIGYLTAGTKTVRSDETIGIPGESGSPVIRHFDGGYATVGSLSFASGMTSRVYDSTTFDAFNALMYGPTASVDDDRASSNLSVAPNPASSHFDISGDALLGYRSARLYSIDGSLLLTGTEPTIDCSSLPPGSYVLEVGTYTATYHRLVTIQR